MEILKGKQAEQICQEILDSYNYEAEKYYNYYGVCGYWYDDEVKQWIAFDNRTGDCWVEQFIGESSARRWVSMN